MRRKKRDQSIDRLPQKDKRTAAPSYRRHHCTGTTQGEKRNAGRHAGVQFYLRAAATPVTRTLPLWPSRHDRGAAGARSRRHLRGAQPGIRVTTREALGRCAAWAAIDVRPTPASPRTPERIRSQPNLTASALTYFERTLTSFYQWSSDATRTTPL
ncbi:unnamed protein product [Leptosia nina]|uniref:Uncharacterized protein n=1 Tax=Leptosia nina TaxID=320188 RepID=A0AAV1JUZ6_9NEOP